MALTSLKTTCYVKQMQNMTELRLVSLHINLWILLSKCTWFLQMAHEHIATMSAIISYIGFMQVIWADMTCLGFIFPKLKVRHCVKMYVVFTDVT